MMTFMFKMIQKTAPAVAAVGATVAMTSVIEQREKQTEQVKKVPGHTCKIFDFQTDAGKPVNVERCELPKIKNK